MIAPRTHTLLADLRQRLAKLEKSSRPADERPVSTGSPALDRLLAAGGLARGSLVEYLSPGPGSGTGTLALGAAREACTGGRALVVVDRSRTFYSLAAAAWGIDLSLMLLLQPADDAAQLWALDQALRCPGVGAVYATCGALDVRDFRRLQLAAESGGTLGVLVRPARLRGQPSWAETQWSVSRVHECNEMHQKVPAKEDEPEGAFRFAHALYGSAPCPRSAARPRRRRRQRCRRQRRRPHRHAAGRGDDSGQACSRHTPCAVAAKRHTECAYYVASRPGRRSGRAGTPSRALRAVQPARGLGNGRNQREVRGQRSEVRGLQLGTWNLEPGTRCF
ncbi:MAG: hypothetical protein L0211_00990 [Planctomycetaceae bacterium]|nr:hypothetical protein [Planctomycetaceae bacterium]